MDTHVDAQYMENTFVIFCIGDGGLLCNKKKELETIMARKNQANINTICIWDLFHCTHPYFSLAEILQPGSGIFHPSRSFVVSGQYIYLCGCFKPRYLLFKKK
jgi:hypothetical protein